MITQIINLDPFWTYMKFPLILSHRSADKLNTASLPKLLLKYFIFDHFWKGNLVVSTRLFFVGNNRPRTDGTNFPNWSVDELIYLHWVDRVLSELWQSKYSCVQGCAGFHVQLLWKACNLNLLCWFQLFNLKIRELLRDCVNMIRFSCVFTRFTFSCKFFHRNFRHCRKLAPEFFSCVTLALGTRKQPCLQYWI